ncbi:MAG: hypothetical protein A2428_02160 [Bdellovibrionales bacterium RIFOXYC1_FULL_54_43]|nr:MAG: hypothetical protein A2428_02160 [Bdellovibrionales bacterium RIFOXYC1_FULL_54_43]
MRTQVTMLVFVCAISAGCASTHTARNLASERDFREGERVYSTELGGGSVIADLDPENIIVDFDHSGETTLSGALLQKRKSCTEPLPGRASLCANERALGIDADGRDYTGMIIEVFDGRPGYPSEVVAIKRDRGSKKPLYVELYTQSLWASGDCYKDLFSTQKACVGTKVKYGSAKGTVKEVFENGTLHIDFSRDTGNALLPLQAVQIISKRRTG